ncbi:MAG: hypothetical protein NW226_04805 [Microscillaceae bacterium]|nr:hypothetical protein [Microscillaceae bacterium]
MSEFQYYEFRAIDKPLSSKARAEISSWSSRTTADAHSAIFTYSYSDFPKNAHQVVEEYFDMMLYYANWGSVQLIIKLPLDLIDLRKIEQYCVGDTISLSKKNDFVLLDFEFNEDEGFEDWIDLQGYLSRLIGIREEILSGNYHSLYLGWLHSIWRARDWEDFEGSDLAPELPDSPPQLTDSLLAFIDLLGIDPVIKDFWMQQSPPAKHTKLLDIAQQISLLSDAEKQAYLLRLAEGEALLSTKFLNHLKKIAEKEEKPQNQSSQKSVQEILAYLHEVETMRINEEQRLKEKDRVEKLEGWAKKEASFWQEVKKNIEEKNAKSYDYAIKILLNLKELAEYKNKTSEFEKRMNEIVQSYSRLSSFKDKLFQKRLIERN